MASAKVFRSCETRPWTIFGPSPGRLSPDLVDQALGRHDLVRAQEEDREERPLLARSDVQHAAPPNDLERPEDAKLDQLQVGVERTMAGFLLPFALGLPIAYRTPPSLHHRTRPCLYATAATRKGRHDSQGHISLPVGATSFFFSAVVGTAPAYVTSDGALWIGALVGVVAFGLVGDTVVGIAILGVGRRRRGGVRCPPTGCSGTAEPPSHGRHLGSSGQAPAALRRCAAPGRSHLRSRP